MGPTSDSLSNWGLGIGDLGIGATLGRLASNCSDQPNIETKRKLYRKGMPVWAKPNNYLQEREPN